MNIEQGISNDEVNRDCQNKRKFDLEERLIDFAVLIIEITKNVRITPAGRHISGQKENKMRTASFNTSDFIISCSIFNICMLMELQNYVKMIKLYRNNSLV